jgi:ZIP family zinc transporter/zinc and cadmium transporter
MLVSYPYIINISQPFLGALLAFSGGALVYVGATHLLPQTETETRKYSLFALGTGIMVALIIVLSKV